jgi:hypothetical protein
MGTKTDNKTDASEAQLRSWINRLDPKNQKLFRTIRAALRKRLPTANELAYDYSSHIVVSYSPTEHAIDAVAAIDARDDGVRLYLMQSRQLPDPKKLLTGSGAQARYVSLETASKLAHPDVEALIAAAITRAKVPLPSKGSGGLFLRGSSEKQRASRRAKK